MCCRLDCRYQEASSPVPCYHTECDKFAKHVGNITFQDVFLRATDHTFEPSVLRKQLRIQSIQQDLAKELHTKRWPRYLAIELWHIIAGFLTREYAILVSQRLEYCLSKHSLSNSLLDMSLNIFVRFVKIEGAYYIQELRNTTGTGFELLFDSTKAAYTQCIDIAEDHIGVQRVLFVSSSDKPDLEYSSNLWWTQLPILASTLEVKTDGLKVRQLGYSTKSSLNIGRSIRWSTRGGSTAELVNLTSCQAQSDYPGSLRMQSFTCNSVHTIGYSACCTLDGTVAVYTHLQDTDITFYQDCDDHPSISTPAWIYMPVDVGEYITEISRINGMIGPYTRHTGLILSTNLRTTMLAAHIPPPFLQHFRIRRIYTPPKSTSQIFFNHWASLDFSQISLMGFEQAQPSRPTLDYPQALTPLSNPPNSTLWYYSTCSLVNVIEITPCYNRRKQHHPIIGLLLRYRNGHQSCIGQYRIDWTSQPMKVIGNQMQVAFENGENYGEILALNVNVLKTIDIRHLARMNIPWSGTLDWWFTDKDCRLSHVD